MLGGKLSLLIVFMVMVTMQELRGSCFANGQSTWPSGTYGLPKTDTGCPTGWSEGIRYHDTEDTGGHNQWSSPIHLSGSRYASGMEQPFCIKTDSRGSGNWPAGTYCVYKYGDCPLGFRPGFIHWDDEDSDNGNRLEGTVPSGSYDSNTRIEFCCRLDYPAAFEISLPTAENFMLLSFRGACQEVSGMIVVEEWFLWDNEDSRNGDDQSPFYHPYQGVQSDASAIRLTFCYYAASDWPVGTYGLPRPTSGCPPGWNTGRRRHDTEDAGGDNDWSTSMHLAGYQYQSSMQHEFCMKTRSRGGRANWQAGRYCIYKYGACPSGFNEGFIYWDDEDSSNSNSRGGVLPSGTYNRNTRMEFCCRNDGQVTRGISLPTNDNFYLFSRSETCQKVNGMSVTKEWFHWDNEDTNNGDQQSADHHPYQGVQSNGFNVRINFCYYQRR